MGSYEYTMGKTLDLKAEQEKTLATPKLPANLILKFMFWQFDVLYGKARSLPKVMVLEILARYPYWAWENGAYHYLSKLYCGTKKVAAEKVETALRHIQMGRESQDNEQWHLLILEEWLQKDGVRQGILLYRVAPQIVAFFYYHVSWLLYVIDPRLSYRLNADFEDHAEHEYMEFVREHPELEDRPFVSEFKADYGNLATLADVLRQIGLDERHHKLESLARIEAPRFS